MIAPWEASHQHLQGTSHRDSLLKVAVTKENSKIIETLEIHIAIMHVNVKKKVATCISLMKMSPLTAELKCPHYEKRHYRHEPERTAALRWQVEGVPQKHIDCPNGSNPLKRTDQGSAQEKTQGTGGF